MIIDCFFCKAKLNWIRRWAGAHEKIAWLEYRCTDCKVSYNLNKFIGQVTDYTIEGDIYRIEFDLTNGSCEIAIPHEMGDHIKWEIIAKLPTSPTNITPQNVNERLKTLVLFS